MLIIPVLADRSCMATLAFAAVSAHQAEAGFKLPVIPQLQVATENLKPPAWPQVRRHSPAPPAQADRIRKRLSPSESSVLTRRPNSTLSLNLNTIATWYHDITIISPAAA
jgi:hypothetical protein